MERGRVVETEEILEQAFLNFRESFTIGVCGGILISYEISGKRRWKGKGAVR